MPSWLARHDGFDAQVNPPFHRTTITVAYLKVVRNPHTKVGHMSPESEVSEVLLALEKAARASNFHLLDLSEVFGTNKWSAVRNIENDVYPFSDNLDKKIIDADLTSRFMASAFQIDAIVSMLDVLSSSANKIKSQFKQSQERISAKISRGFNRLPDELIAAVFQFAVRDKGNEGGRQAISLSQTSRRFRNIALRTRSLWNILSSSNSTKQLETFIARAGSNEEYNIFVHHTPRMFSPGIDRFTNACRSSASHWKTMTLTQDDKLCVSNAMNGGVIVLLRNLSVTFVKHGLQLPMLEELDIRGSTQKTYISSLRENLLWAPNLQTLRCAHALLNPSAPISSVSIFEYTQLLSESFIPLRLLLNFLSYLPNITTFRLDLQGANELVCGTELRATECPSIISFHLRLRSLQVKTEPTPQSSCLAPLLDALRLPSLENYSISLGFGDTGLGGEMDGEGWTLALGELSTELMPTHFSESNRLTSLSYSLFLDRDTPLAHWEEIVPYDKRAFHIPLDRIFNIKTLSISSWIRVQFVKQDPYRRRVDIRERCRLRDLNFVGCANMGGADLSSVVSSLVCEFDVWRDIGRVTIRGCKNLAYDDVMWIIGEEKLHYPD